MELIHIDEEKCTSCGLCIPLCVRGVLEEGESAVRVTNPDKCTLCGHCKAICPVDAPELPTLEASEFMEAPGRGSYPTPEVLLSILRSRRSIRRFKNKSVEREKLETIIQAGRFAPTGGNRQGIQYVVISTPSKIAEIKRMTVDLLARQAEEIDTALELHERTGQPVPVEYEVRKVYTKRWKEMKTEMKSGIDKLFYHAPALVALHINPSESTSPMVDAGLAGMQMVLMAEGLDLGTCFCGFFVFAVNMSLEFKNMLAIPEAHIVPLSFVVGYPDVHFKRLVSRNPARVTWY